MLEVCVKNGFLTTAGRLCMKMKYKNNYCSL